MLEKAKEHISNNGYGKGSNFTVDSIAYLIVGFAKPLIYELEKLQTDQKLREHIDSVLPDEPDYKTKYEKCIEIIKRFDAGIIGMYDL
jgi:hypothetical protein